MEVSAVLIVVTGQYQIRAPVTAGDFGVVGALGGDSLRCVLPP